MQINQPLLQLLLYKKAQNEQTKTQEATSNQTEVANSSVQTTPTNIITTPTSEDYKTADAFAMQSSNRTTIANEITDNERISSQNAITISALSESQIREIKYTIYNLHHRTSTPNGGGTSGSEPTPTPTPTPTPSVPSTSGAGNISFMSDFSNVDEMFEYMNSEDSSITKASGLSDSQLWKLSQRDDWEETNNNFFGKLNQSFNLIDTNGDDVLSYDEICAFIGDEMDLSEYNSAVNQYSNYLQSLFATMTPDEKLAFSIERAKEYLEAVGLTQQLAALNRLQTENKLGFADLNPGSTYREGAGGWTLGSYQYWIDTNDNWYTDNDYFKDINNDGYDDATGVHYSECFVYDENSTKTYEEQYYEFLYQIDPDNNGKDSSGNSVNVYFDFYDEDGDGKDDYFGGIFLDKYYYTQRANTQWYDLVATLIHELTHATASFNPTDETKWGEYVAYQTEEDYLDSIAHGQYSGSREGSEITTHINTYYEDEPVPSFDWETYGSYA